MDNSASLALSYANTQVDERVESLTYLDNLNGSLQGLSDQVYDLEESCPRICQETHSKLMKELVNMMNRNLRFVPREQISFQGDEFNLLMNIWISIIKAMMVKRNSTLESSKLRVLLNGKRSRKLKEQMTGYFLGFLKAIRMAPLEQKLIKPRTLRAIIKL